MRASKLFARTLREAPAEAEAPSHRLLIRGAYIRKVMAGVYTTLPLGVRTMRKIESIIRDEMDASGAQEIRMPIVLPAEPWKVTGRWRAYGDEMFKLKDRHGRELGLGPTQEEVVTPLVAGDFSSYRDLPVNLYQIEWKYRDEMRPRFGLMRGREFLMKDAYSFDRDQDGLARSYAIMYEAYRRVFDRCGLSYRIVEADPGAIGGDVNHEYMALTPAGEDLFLYCEGCDYAADMEAATPAWPGPAEPAAPHPLEEISTPGAATIQAVATMTGRPAREMLKCMLYGAGDRTVAVLLPGDREVSDKKVARALWPTPVRLFDEDDFDERGFVKGYVGPQGLPADVTVIADRSVRSGSNWVTGANRADHHVTGANEGRDFRVDRWEDVVQAAEGDRCPKDGGLLRLGRAIVVGHIYQLGTRYSRPLKATFVDEDGTEQPYVMGCYGIGISRILAAVAEQHHDEQGLRWPAALAPFDAVVIPTNMDMPAVVEAAEGLYAGLRDAGLEAVLDDREASAGVKFADADLIGYPVQVVIGKRGIASGTVDLKVRATGERRPSPIDGAVPAVRELFDGAP
ncbi:MAG TPA: proline--tRNA ligase [Actinomycetota bacterium]|nr:proline--tRNA ligase [Actinomycetota bacterium]